MLFRSHAYPLRSSRPKLPNKVPSGPAIIIFVQLEIPHVLRDNLGLSLPLLLVFLNSLVFIDTIHKPTHTPDRLLSQDFLKSCSASKPTLKVLMATSLKSPSISLNISKYLFKYVFRVSHSRMDMDSRESKSRATLMQMIKRDPNAQVSSLKELMEPTPRPSNHFIAMGPKLEGNTLHIKVSFLECTTIL